MAEMRADVKGFEDLDDDLVSLQGFFSRMRKKAMKIAVRKAIRLLRKYLRKYPYVKRLAERTFCRQEHENRRRPILERSRSLLQRGRPQL